MCKQETIMGFFTYIHDIVLYYAHLPFMEAAYYRPSVYTTQYIKVQLTPVSYCNTTTLCVQLTVHVFYFQII